MIASMIYFCFLHFQVIIFQWKGFYCWTSFWFFINRYFPCAYFLLFFSPFFHFPLVCSWLFSYDSTDVFHQNKTSIYPFSSAPLTISSVRDKKKTKCSKMHSDRYSFFTFRRGRQGGGWLAKWVIVQLAVSSLNLIAQAISVTRLSDFLNVLATYFL